MPLGDLLAGALLLAALLVACGAATAIVVRRRLAHLDALERSVAAATIGVAILLAVHLAPLALGVLSPATVLAAAALAVALAALVRAAAPAAVVERAPAPTSRPLEWALAAVAALLAAAAALADLARWAGDELVGVDPLTFHMPNVARWIQSGSLWQVDQFVPLLAHGNYPNNGDVLLLAFTLPWRNDFLVRAPTALFVVLTAVAVAALARELRAPPAAAVLAGAAAVSLPVVGLASIPRALPDSLLWATFAAGALFLARHARSGRRSDLVLAAVALAVATGTKWYGVSSLAVALAVWAGARLLAARRRGERAQALRDALAVGALATAGVAVWLARNAVESGNPWFPVRVEAFGVTLLDAPRDVLREQAGASIADYLGDGAVMRQLAGELYDGLGPVAVMALAGLAIALAGAAARAAGRRARPRDRPPAGLARVGGDGRVLAVAVAAIALLGAYALTPYSALGLRGDPSLANANTRYAIPALTLGLAVSAWVAGRLRPAAAVALQAALVAAAAAGALDGYEIAGPGELALALGALAVLALAAALARAGWMTRPRPAVAAAAAALAVAVALAGAHRVAERVNDARYLGIDPAVDALLRAVPSGGRIGLAADWSVEGLSPIWPAFGTRIGNEVEYVGEHPPHGFLDRFRDRRRFQAALRRRGYDALVVGRGFFPPQPTPEQRWAIDAGWRTIGLSRRLRVLLPPPRP